MSGRVCNWTIRYRLAGTEYEFRGQYGTKTCGKPCQGSDYFTARPTRP